VHPAKWGKQNNFRPTRFRVGTGESSRFWQPRRIVGSCRLFVVLIKYAALAAVLDSGILSRQLATSFVEENAAS